MKTEQIIKMLQNLNASKHGAVKKQNFSITDLIKQFNTINAAIEQLQTLEREREEAWSYLNELERGHLFAQSAWEKYPKKKSMDDMSWFRMVAACAVKKAIMEGSK